VDCYKQQENNMGTSGVGTLKGQLSGLIGLSNSVSVSSSNLAYSNLSASRGGQALGGSAMYALNPSFGLSEEGIHPSVKKYEVYETPTDILALSVAWKRLRDIGRTGIGKLLQDELFQEVTNNDEEKAKEIRDYYSKKIMVHKLKNDIEYSSFKKDLNHFVHTSGTLVKEQMLGLAYYLPIFHEYDTNLDQVRSSVDPNQNFKKLDKQGQVKVMTLEASLTPLQTIVKKTKRNTTIEYWCKDDKLNAGVVIKVQPDNPLKHLWDDIFNTSKVLKIKGAYCRRNLDNFEYFSVTHWQLLKG